MQGRPAACNNQLSEPDENAIPVFFMGAVSRRLYLPRNFKGADGKPALSNTIWQTI